MIARQASEVWSMRVRSVDMREDHEAALRVGRLQRGESLGWIRLAGRGDRRASLVPAGQLTPP